MARVVRSCWVYKPRHHVKHLPQPNVRQTFDYEENQAGPENFPEHLNFSGNPPKIWAVWMTERLM